MKIAVDTCVGKRGIALLVSAGHELVVEARQAEPDREWFARAVARGVELIVSSDSDLEIHCYDHDIKFFRAQQKHRGVLTAERVLLRYPARTEAP